MATIQLNNYAIDITENFRDQPHFVPLFTENDFSKIFVLADENTRTFCLPVIAPFLPEFQLITIRSGESEKNIDTCKYLWEQLMDMGAERSSLLINLGGGVIGDMGGFVAGTFKRGLPFIHIPTTLLAQVDASVGGKLGIDLNGVKNLVGLFQDPKHIYISAEFLRTLPFEQVRSGFAEMLKHGLISDKAYWQVLKDTDLRQFVAPEKMIKRSVEIKKQVVASDPYEKGLRKILNFGHTIGHAIETLSLNGNMHPLLHGEAIAIGMICEAWLSASVNGLPESELTDITTCLMHHFPKQDITPLATSELLHVMQMDKKNKNGKIQFSLLHTIGNCGFDITADEKLIQASLNYYQNQ